MEAAWAETVTWSVRAIRPSSRASITSSRVMILVTLAGSRLSWAFCSHRTVPVSFSIRTAAAASTWGLSAAAAAAGQTSSPAQSRTARVRFIMALLLHHRRFL